MFCLISKVIIRIFYSFCLSYCLQWMLCKSNAMSRKGCYMILATISSIVKPSSVVVQTSNIVSSLETPQMYYLDKLFNIILEGYELVSCIPLILMKSKMFSLVNVLRPFWHPRCHQRICMKRLQDTRSYSIKPNNLFKHKPTLVCNILVGWFLFNWDV